MRVSCLSNSGATLPENYVDARSGYGPSAEFPITVGKEYVVYAIALWNNAQVWYYVSDDDDLNYPFRYPAPLFEVADSSVSRYWRYAFTPEHLDHVALFAFEEWVRDAYFFDRLTDDSELEVSTFRKMKDLMDSEPSLSDDPDYDIR